MENISFEIVNQYRAWEHSDEFITEVNSLDEVVDKYIEIRIERNKIAMMDGPEPAIYVCYNGLVVGEVAWFVGTKHIREKLEEILAKPDREPILVPRNFDKYKENNSIYEDNGFATPENFKSRAEVGKITDKIDKSDSTNLITIEIGEAEIDSQTKAMLECMSVGDFSSSICTYHASADCVEKFVDFLRKAIVDNEGNKGIENEIG